MRTRVTTALLFSILFFLSIFTYDTNIFNYMLIIILIIAISELFNSLFQTKHFAFLILNYTIPLFLLLGDYHFRRQYMLYYVYFLFITNIFLLFKYHKDVKINDLCLFIIFSLLMSMSLQILIFFRETKGQHALFYSLLGFSSAWFCDIGAYFIGYYFGKRKLCPSISPKKTLAGAIGGIIINLILIFIISYIIKIYIIDINILNTAILSFFASILGMVGDLSASIIKRHYNIKDFGDVMPGHGGIIDRFDSVFFTLPSIFLVSIFFPV